MEQKAKEFATAKHAEVKQVRKYTGEPYINHPASVVELVRGVEHTDAMICAAWLHDTVEDTDTTLAEIESEFGLEVASYVECLTDVSSYSDGNRAKRKAIDREHISHAPPCVQTIKLADLIDNSASIIERDPEFAKVYLKEKILLLEVLKDGDKVLWEQASAIAACAI